MAFRQNKNLNFFDLQFRSQITDFNRRRKYAKKELNTYILKAVLDVTSANGKYKTKAHQNNSFEIGSMAQKKYQTNKISTFTRVRNRCVLTGRSTTLQEFRQSRISFREQAALGQLLGISKRLNK